MKKEFTLRLLMLVAMMTPWLCIEARVLHAQTEDEDFLGGDETEEAGHEEVGKTAKDVEEEKRKAAEEERLKKEEEDRRQKAEEEAKARTQREAVRKAQVKERKREEAQAKELDAMREAAMDTTEYTLNPDAVELVVEMDPNGYGFRTRTHRMTLTADIDPLMSGRGFLTYNFRFFNYLSFGIMGGVDWSEVSLYKRFREQFNKVAPKQFAVLGGLNSRMRLTEWYMKSSLFIEASAVFGRLWQTYGPQKTEHWRFRPGGFGGVETVFDSGLSFTTRLGVEFPFDYGTPNPVKEVAEPLLMFGMGLAI